jgi:hypothetical protein
MMQTVNARGLHVVAVLDPAEVLKLPLPDGEVHVEVRVRLPLCSLPAELAARSVRRVIASVREHGPDGCLVTIRGRYDGGDRLLDCGISAQQKALKAVPADDAV